MQTRSIAQTLRIAGLAVIGLVVAFLLFMGIGEMASGDLSGASHLIPAVVLAGLAALSLKTLRGSGAALAVVGLAVGIFFYMQMGKPETRLTAIMLTGAPILLGGLLLMAASGMREKAGRA